MKIPRVIGLLGLALLASLFGRAAYAPTPISDSGKDLTLSLTAGVTRDSNLFGSSTGEIETTVYHVEPKVAYEASVTDQTFVTAYYQLTVDYFDNRPGEKTLYSHNVLARVAHAFSPVTNFSLTDAFVVAKNPESLLAGIPINTDQSYQRNQFDALFATAPTKKTNVTVKARSIYYDYRSASLGRSLDRTENLYGLVGDLAVLPEVKAVAEYRHQDVTYRSASDNKDKHSDFFLAGADYAAGPKLSASTRLGFEFRRRSGERSETSPYAEFSGKYGYAKRSFVSAGYVHTLEESSDVVRFTDTQINRFFVNAQHPLSSRIVASGSLSYEPSKLQGRRGRADLDETTTRFGAALTYLAARNWSVAASYDYDNIDSDDAARGQVRQRVGVSATYAF
ncbi:MAG: outer membrane beta-barrel protein [Undibacterium sp.]|nr:outer membrane beta-barrel protein [Opitutaceae bacterium]